MNEIWSISRHTHFDANSW